MFEFVILAVSDVFWGSAFSALGLIVVAWITKGNTKRLVSIDDAVNHKETGMPTMVQRLIDQDDRGVQLAEELAEFREWTQDAFVAFAEAQNVVIPPVPKPVKPTNVQLPKDSQNPQSDPHLNQQPNPTATPEHGDTDSLSGEVHVGS